MTDCICEYGIGRPGISSHSDACTKYQNTQAIMERDAVTIEEQDKEIARLRADLSYITEALSPVKDDLISAYHVVTGIICAHTDHSNGGD